MLVAISGSQGSGKSTVLAELEKRGYEVVKRKSARSILDDWGVTLNEVNEDHDLTIKFQAEITKRKFEDEMMKAMGPNLCFTERTHADLFIYALIDLGRVNEYSEWVDEYYRTCLGHNQMYRRVYFLRAGRFHVEHDGVRGSNKHYSRMADLTMLDFTQQMVHPERFSIIESSDIQQRVDIIEAQCSGKF